MGSPLEWIGGISRHRFAAEMNDVSPPPFSTVCGSKWPRRYPSIEFCPFATANGTEWSYVPSKNCTIIRNLRSHPRLTTKEYRTMRKGFALAIAISFLLGNLIAQTPQQQSPQRQPPPPPERKLSPEDILRITTELVQTDVVVTDKNERIIPDLKLTDFEVFENGKKQDLQFMEFISIDEAGRSEGTANVARIAPGIDTAVSKDNTIADVRRVIGFVVDDVTIPAKDMSRVRDMLTNFVDTKMREGDLVAIVRTFGGKGLLEQFTSDRNILRQSVAQLGVRSIPPYLAFGGPEAGRVTKVPTLDGAHDTSETIGDLTIDNGLFPDAPAEGVNQVGKSYMALSLSNVLVNS